MLTIRTTRFALLMLCLSLASIVSAQLNPNHKVGSITGKVHFTTAQTPDQLVEIYPVYSPSTGLTYQWEQSSQPLSGFTNISGATSSAFTFSGPLSTTTFYRRKTNSVPGNPSGIYSNVIKISVVSSNWEDINYLRENTVLVTGVSNWGGVEQLPIGDKLQTTSYMDGIGRKLQTISREAATPSSPSGPWGDMVQFAQYDAYGRQPLQYLPYTTASQSGKYKTAPLTEQPLYYSTNYNETSAYASVTYDNSPLNRTKNIKQQGTVWAAANGISATYELNTLADNVQIFGVRYELLDINPKHEGVYPVNTLYKQIRTNENGKQIIEFINKMGKLILRKIQLDDNPSAGHLGWICTYNIYDDFGQLRYRIQPEGVNFLESNNWSFTHPILGNAILRHEQMFQYAYDEKGRTIWKKAPGAEPLRMIYDTRDRVVFMQDGNQAALSTAQWTTNIYDELDRSLLSALYNTTKSVATLQSDINSASLSNTITINNTGTVSVTVPTHYNPLSSSDLNNSGVTTVLNYSFYDNYSFNGTKSFNTNNTNTTAYSTSDPNVMPIAWSKRVMSMPTGGMTRVLGTATFLSSTVYYDERGSAIQSLADNVKGGEDIATMQYHFDGRLLSSCSDHTVPSTAYTNYKILTKNLFDKLGRITSIQKKFGDNSFKTIADYAYDDAGRLKEKKLAPGYTGSGGTQLESLTYSYNIHNQITGINKDYALKNPANYNKWGHFFGMYLGFDNSDNVFNNANLAGQVTGILWNTQGDDAQRKFDFTYDNAGRLINAIFKEKKHTGDAWSNTEMDFSTTGNSGKITYDLNGNLLNLLQKGVVPGNGSPITIDNLSYTYGTLSNKLQSVTDVMTSTAVNGQFGDFKDGANGANPDYVYDANGNLVIDLNKNAKDLAGVTGANGIKYNFLDKPEEIRVAGKGTIKIVYSAGGKKLQRTFTPEGGGTAKTTSYINQYVYEETAGGSASLQYISFEEGRVRVVSPLYDMNVYDAFNVAGNINLPALNPGENDGGVFDYYILDYQQNVRMILTEGEHTAHNTATMETDRATLEQSIFGQEGVNNEVATTRTTTPVAWDHADIGDYVSKLGTNAGYNIGPNTLQRVMAGDKVSANVLYYHQTTAGGNSSAMVSNVLGSLLQAIGGTGNTMLAGHGTAINSNLGGLPGFANAVQPNGSSPSGTTPQAFLTVLFFDERFNFIPAADGGVAQIQVDASVGTSGSSLTLDNIKAPKNGYAYVYLSNQSSNDVYFDNFKVGIAQGNIVEENHYHAYGLKITAISSRKFGSSLEGQVKNNYLYNDKELLEDGDLNWYDYGFRNYDPQIGRFPQLDPLTDQYPFLTPYQYASCDPVTNIDVDGLEGSSAVSGAGKAFTYSYEAANLTTQSFLRTLTTTATKSAPKSTKLIEIGANVLLRAANVAANKPESTCVGCAEANKRIQMAELNKAWQNRSFKEKYDYTTKHPAVSYEVSVSRTEQEKWAIAINDTYGEALEYVPVLGDLHDLKDVITGLSQGDFVSASISAFFLIPGTDFLKPVKSLVKKDKQLLKFAKETFKGNKELSKEATDLVDKYRKGLDGGKGGHALQGKAFEGTGISELRGDRGSRVYYRDTNDGGFEILGYSNKNNQTEVINRIANVYGN